ncbi:MAG: asparagine synthase-related protein [Pantoea sp.]|uniref:asparagine synthase-related protein n=1 Tax=Pantoea sp. TaxID=69393 RepID=UPI0039E5EA3C
MHITCLNTPVCSTSGEETELDCHLFHGKNIHEVVQILSEKYSGDVVFILEKDNTLTVLRPPFSEFVVFYSFIKDKIELWSGYYIPEKIINNPPTYNFSYLSGWLLNPAWCTPETGLSDINELLSGAVLFFDGEVLEQKDLLSGTVMGLGNGSGKDFEQTADHFRNLILNSTQHKTKQFNSKFSISCSGGLDSSVVSIAAEKVSREWPVPLLNCYSEEDYHGDERFYFRIINEMVKGKPFEVETNSLSSRNSLSSDLLAPSARPCKMSAAVGIQTLLFRMTAKNGCQMILTGDGGDQLFLKLNKTFIWKEILEANFSGVSFMKIISGLAIQQRQSFWSVLKDVISRESLKQYRGYFFGEMKFPASDLLCTRVHCSASLVPNQHLLKNIGYSKLFQFFGMRNAEFNRIAIRGCNIQERKVFVFWPLVKAALQTPRMFHMIDGNDRAIERMAFRKELPDEIFYRKSKGAGRDILSRYDYECLAETLLQGPACRHGFVSREKLQQIKNKNIEVETAASLIRATALNDWMKFYEYT